MTEPVTRELTCQDVKYQTENTLSWKLQTVRQEMDHDAFKRLVDGRTTDLCSSQSAPDRFPLEKTRAQLSDVEKCA